VWCSGERRVPGESPLTSVGEGSLVACHFSVMNLPSPCHVGFAYSNAMKTPHLHLMAETSVTTPWLSESAVQTHQSRAVATPAPSTISVQWVRTQSELLEVQRLRYEVFCQELGAQLRTPLPGHDVDLFDDFCEHLLVRDERTQHVVGTYRLLTPVQAKRAGSYYSDVEFDLTRLRFLRDQMVELGRSCVHPDHRHGGVIMALWSALAKFMQENQLRWMIGCATIPMKSAGAGHGHMAASIWRKLMAEHAAPIEHHVRARLPLPVDHLDQGLDVEPPPLIKGYLRLGAKILGVPAWDPDFDAADLPMLMCLDDMPARYRKHLLGQ
jgi:putative hemolysin